MNEFETEVAARISENAINRELSESATDFLLKSVEAKYSYNYSWMGRPIIQYPQDIVAMQELVWATRPDLIIETGIAHGGSLILSASMLALLDMTDAIAAGKAFDPARGRRKVLGVDIDIRAHNRAAIEAHPMASYILMMQGSSIDQAIVQQVHDFAKPFERILVCLDSNHTHDHVLAELEAYAQIVTRGSYCVVFDTVIEDIPSVSNPERPWGLGNNPKTAVRKYLQSHPEFEIDKTIEKKLMITVAPDGFLKRRS